MGVGAKNLITDVSGLSCGSVFDTHLRSGVSVILPDEGSTAACHVSGGAPGVIGHDVLESGNIVERIDGLFLFGRFGLWFGERRGNG